jgi:hypothetical protein
MAGEDYQLSVSDNLVDWDPVGFVIVAPGAGTTPATITVADLDGVLGAGPHPTVFVRVAVSD